MFYNRSSLTAYGLLIVDQPSPRRAAYCIPHGPPPPPQLFVYQLLLPHTSHSHHIPLGNCFGDILIPISSTLKLLWPLTKKCSLAHFRNKLPSDLFLIWQICSAMSANDLINFWDKTISIWRFSCHFDFLARQVYPC